MTIEDDRPKQTPDDFLIVKTFPPMCFHRRKDPDLSQFPPIGDTDYSALGYFSSENFGAWFRKKRYGKCWIQPTRNNPQKRDT